MKIAKRVLLFLATNVLILLTVSLIFSFLGVGPFLTSHGLNYETLIIFCAVWGMGGAFISLLLSRWIAKMAMGVQVISPATARGELRELIDITYTLAKKAGMTTMPEVGVFESAAPNAFATGPSQSRSLVAVSSGLLSQLKKEEVAAVIGHELAHIVNGDMVTMTLLQGVVNAFVMFLSRVLAFALSSTKRDGERSSVSPGSFYLFTMLFEIIFMLLGSIIIALYSRKREYRADAGGAYLTTKEQMIGALRSLERSRLTENAPAAVQTLMLKPGKHSGVFRLFSTHPSIEDRIAAIEAADLRHVF